MHLQRCAITLWNDCNLLVHGSPRKMASAWRTWTRPAAAEVRPTAWRRGDLRPARGTHAPRPWPRDAQEHERAPQERHVLGEVDHLHLLHLRRRLRPERVHGKRNRNQEHHDG